MLEKLLDGNNWFPVVAPLTAFVALAFVATACLRRLQATLIVSRAFGVIRRSTCRNSGHRPHVRPHNEDDARCFAAQNRPLVCASVWFRNGHPRIWARLAREPLCLEQ